jgi:hypothetical protein
VLIAVPRTRLRSHDALSAGHARAARQHRKNSCQAFADTCVQVVLRLRVPIRIRESDQRERSDHVVPVGIKPVVLH